MLSIKESLKIFERIPFSFDKLDETLSKLGAPLRLPENFSLSLIILSFSLSIFSLSLSLVFLSFSLSLFSLILPFCLPPSLYLYISIHLSIYLSNHLFIFSSYLSFSFSLYITLSLYLSPCPSCSISLPFWQSLPEALRQVVIHKWYRNVFWLWILIIIFCQLPDSLTGSEEGIMKLPMEEAKENFSSSCTVS